MSNVVHNLTFVPIPLKEGMWSNLRSAWKKHLWEHKCQTGEDG